MESGRSANKLPHSPRPFFQQQVEHSIAPKQPYSKLQPGQRQPCEKYHHGPPHQTLLRKQLTKTNIVQSPAPIAPAQCFRAIMKTLAPM